MAAGVPSPLGDGAGPAMPYSPVARRTYSKTGRSRLPTGSGMNSIL